MSEQIDRNSLRELGIKSKALWNIVRISAVLGAGSVLSMLAGAVESETANRQGISNANHIAETALSSHLIEYSAIGAGGAIALGATALIGYVQSSSHDWANAARQAREVAQSSEGHLS